jgi:hypothetical protein
MDEVPQNLLPHRGGDADRWQWLDSVARYPTFSASSYGDPANDADI